MNEGQSEKPNTVTSENVKKIIEKIKNMLVIADTPQNPEETPPQTPTETPTEK